MSNDETTNSLGRWNGSGYSGRIPRTFSLKFALFIVVAGCRRRCGGGGLLITDENEV
jgi:hypothetical protein